MYKSSMILLLSSTPPPSSLFNCLLTEEQSSCAKLELFVTLLLLLSFVLLFHIISCDTSRGRSSQLFIGIYGPFIFKSGSSSICRFINVDIWSSSPKESPGLFKEGGKLQSELCKHNRQSFLQMWSKPSSATFERFGDSNCGDGSQESLYDMKGSDGSSVNKGQKLSLRKKSSNMSVRKGWSSRGTQTSPATGAKCVRSSGSSFNTETKRKYVS